MQTLALCRLSRSQKTLGVLGGGGLMSAGRSPGGPALAPEYLEVLLQDLLMLLLLVQDVLLLRLLQGPLIHVAPVHLLELLTLLKRAPTTHTHT